MINNFRKVCALVLIFIYVGLLLFSAETEPISSELLYSFEVRRDTIEMNDGVKLAVTYFFPNPIYENEKFPIILNVDPYRKEDFFYSSDYQRNSYFAERGFVTARIDLRGTGSSQGTLPDKEYSEIEMKDIEEVIDFLSKKDYANSNVGMYGMSWSAFNSIMTAMRTPPALKAVIALHGSEDLYYNDIHFYNGVMHVDYYDQQIDTDNALPESNSYSTSGDFFETRFNREPWLLIEMKNQQDNEFWRKESLRFNEPLEVPAYVIGGLLDGYRDFAPYIFENSYAPVKMDIGPYNHTYPNNSSIGPLYEWRETAVRWWDYWLKGIDNGIMNEPLVTIFVREGHDPSTTLSETPGSWRSEETWPIADTKYEKFFPGNTNNLVSIIPSETEYELSYSAGAGMAAGGWWGEPVGDMKEDDNKSLVYDSEELKERIQIIGNPLVSLRLEADFPLYQWSVRLEDVSPEGKVSLVSGVLINPSQKKDRLNPKPIIPGEAFILTGKIHFTTWTFKPGHKIRLSVSNAQFPMSWPTPYKGSTKLFSGSDTWIELPVPPISKLSEPILPKPQKEKKPPDYEDIYYFPPSVSIEREELKGNSNYKISSDYAWKIGENDFSSSEFYTWSVQDDNPAEALFSGMRRDIFNVYGKNLLLYCIFNISSDEQNFNISITRTILENGVQIREKTWNEIIPRNLQ